MRCKTLLSVSALDATCTGDEGLVHEMNKAPNPIDRHVGAACACAGDGGHEPGANLAKRWTLRFSRCRNTKRARTGSAPAGCNRFRARSTCPRLLFRRRAGCEIDGRGNGRPAFAEDASTSLCRRFPVDRRGPAAQPGFRAHQGPEGAQDGSSISSQRSPATTSSARGAATFGKKNAIDSAFA